MTTLSPKDKLGSKPLPKLKIPNDPDRPNDQQLSQLFKNYTPNPDHVREEGIQRCRISCKQTEAQRQAGKEPQCSGWCYLNFGKGFRAAVKEARRQALGRPEIPLTPDEKIEDERFQYQFLEGKYVITFSGKKNYHNHVEFMSLPPEVMVLCYQVQQEKNDAMRKLISEANFRLRMNGIRSKRYELSSVNMGIFSFADYTSHILSSVRSHFIRILKPGYVNITKIPEHYQDGTYTRVIQHIWENMKEGKGLEIGGKMIHSTGSLMKQVWENKRTGGGGGGDNGTPGSGFGGLGPGTEGGAT